MTTYHDLDEIRDVFDGRVNSAEVHLTISKQRRASLDLFPTDCPYSTDDLLRVYVGSPVSSAQNEELYRVTDPTRSKDFIQGLTSGARYYSWPDFVSYLVNSDVPFHAIKVTRFA